MPALTWPLAISARPSTITRRRRRWTGCSSRGEARSRTGGTCVVSLVGLQDTERGRGLKESSNPARLKVPDQGTHAVLMHEFDQPLHLVSRITSSQRTQNLADLRSG